MQLLHERQLRTCARWPASVAAVSPTVAAQAGVVAPGAAGAGVARAARALAAQHILPWLLEPSNFAALRPSVAPGVLEAVAALAFEEGHAHRDAAAQLAERAVPATLAAMPLRAPPSLAFSEVWFH